MKAKDNNVPWSDFNLLQISGMVQELYMTYIYIAMMTVYVYVGYLPAP